MNCARRGYTLLEMLTTIAALVIVLGLMVSLARHVRREQADRLTRGVLQRLDQAMAQYIRVQNGGHVPAVPLLLASSAAPNRDADEPLAARNAAANNQAFVEALRAGPADKDLLLADLPAAVYDERTVRDAWGSPIVFMPTGHTAVGIAPNRSWFFFSAGPDQRYLRDGDNINSYQLGAGIPASLPAHGGQDE